MKGAIVLVLMLCLGFLAAQSIEARGYTLTQKDSIYLQNIFAAIDRKGDINQDTLLRFTPYLNYFPSNSRQHKLFQEIYVYVSTSNTSVPSTSRDSSSSTYSQNLIRLLGEQFQ